MRVSYIRVSSEQQNYQRQEIALKDKGIEKYFIEKISGKTANRPELKAMLQFVRDGDTIYIESISRLARNVRDFLNIMQELTEKNVQVISLKEMIDTSTPQGKFMLTVFGALFELEREMTHQRQMEGISIAKANNVKFGRKKITNENFEKVYDYWKKGTISAVQCMRQLGMKKNTFYRRVKEYEENKKE